MHPLRWPAQPSAFPMLTPWETPASGCPRPPEPGSCPRRLRQREPNQEGPSVLDPRCRHLRASSPKKTEWQKKQKLGPRTGGPRSVLGHARRLSRPGPGPPTLALRPDRQRKVRLSETGPRAPSGAGHTAARPRGCVQAGTRRLVWAPRSESKTPRGQGLVVPAAVPIGARGGLARSRCSVNTEWTAA